ncbi:MAG: ATPase [Thermoprotei archaeon]|nr:MAG: ATPase [Thermoprotei archaeon]
MIWAGVDGGATKTLAVVVSEKREIGVGISGPSNYHDVGLEKAVANLREALDQALSQIGGKMPVTSACYGLAGLDSPSDFTVVEEAITKVKLADKNFVVHDSVIAIYGATGGNKGIIVIAGTGSVAAGLDDKGNYIRVGGWGPLLGDEGSAYMIGREALAHALKAYDGRGEKTSLLDRIIEKYNLKQVEEIIDIFYRKGVSVTEVASLAKIVSEEALKGDKVAKMILEKAAKEIALHIVAVYKRLGFREKIDVALIGGVFRAGELILSPLKKYLAEKSIEVNLIKPKYPPAIGALIIAIKNTAPEFLSAEILEEANKAVERYYG